MKKEKLNVISLGEFMVSSKTESLSQMKKVANELMKEHKELIKEINNLKKESEQQSPELEGNYFGLIGTTTPDTNFQVIGVDGKPVVKADIFELKEAWQKTLLW